MRGKKVKVQSQSLANRLAGISVLGFGASHVVQSLFKIREELTNGLKRVGDNSPAKDSFRINASCVSGFPYAYKREKL